MSVASTPASVIVETGEPRTYPPGAMAYWCPDWYPADAAERPCDRFFTAGLYLLDVDAHDRELEPSWEGDPDEVACREHDSKPDRVTAAEWDDRLERARDLAAARSLAGARGWVVPEPELWDDPAAFGPVIGPWGEQCNAPTGYDRCGRQVMLVGVERPIGTSEAVGAGETTAQVDGSKETATEAAVRSSGLTEAAPETRIYQKAICAHALSQAQNADSRFALSDLARTSHVNRCLPWMPPNC